MSLFNKFAGIQRATLSKNILCFRFFTMIFAKFLSPVFLSTLRDDCSRRALEFTENGAYSYRY